VRSRSAACAGLQKMMEHDDQICILADVGSFSMHSGRRGADGMGVKKEMFHVQKERGVRDMG